MGLGVCGNRVEPVCLLMYPWDVDGEYSLVPVENEECTKFNEHQRE